MDLSKLTNEELIALRREKEIEISKSHNMQMAKKILLNSCYGAMSNPYFLYYSDVLAESITLSGQLSIQWVSKYINVYLNKLLGTTDKDFIIANDTDSCYVNLEAIVMKVMPHETDKFKIVEFIDKLCKTKIADVIAQAYEDLATMMNAFSQKMRMKRENIADMAVWTAKKRYIMNVYDSEGVRYKEPKVKVVGIEAVRSSTPFVVREYIKKALDLIVADDESKLHDYIKHCRQEFGTLRFEEVGKPSGVKGTVDYFDKYNLYRKGTPIHVRASLIYNKIIQENQLDKKFPVISDGDKIKFCYMKMPNPLRENVFAVSTVLPSQLQLEKYIDYDKQFEVVFISPLKKILDAIGWTTEKVSSLESFFI